MTSCEIRAPEKRGSRTGTADKHGNRAGTPEKHETEDMLCRAPSHCVVHDTGSAKACDLTRAPLTAPNVLHADDGPTNLAIGLGVLSSQSTASAGPAESARVDLPASHVQRQTMNRNAAFQELSPLVSILHCYAGHMLARAPCDEINSVRTLSPPAARALGGAAKLPRGLAGGRTGLRAAGPESPATDVGETAGLIDGRDGAAPGELRLDVRPGGGGFD